LPDIALLPSLNVAPRTSGRIIATGEQDSQSDHENPCYVTTHNDLRAVLVMAKGQPRPEALLE
jgi:hypothetical protein